MANSSDTTYKDLFGEEHPLDFPVAVIPHRAVRGVHAPGTIIPWCKRSGCKGPHTSDWRAPRRSIENVHRVSADLHVTTMREAVSTAYTSEALFVSYLVTRDGVPVDPMPRIAKDALPWMREEGFEVVMGCFLADWDTPGHVPWTGELLARFHDQWSRCEPLQSCGIYLSPRGARIVQPIDRWLPVEEGEARLTTWLGQLIAAGLPEDLLKCRDWTHLQRVPRFRSAKGNVVPSFEDYMKAKPITPPEPSARLRARSKPRKFTGAPGEVPAFTEAIPEGWDRVADAVGAAIRDGVKSDWRRCYMALAGALLERGLDPAACPAVIGRAHMVDPAWEAYLADRMEIARTTVTKRAAGDSILSYRVLRQDFPEVADALDVTTLDPAEARLTREIAAPAPEFMSLPDALAVIRKVFENPYGVVCVKGPPGIGKTTIACERIAKLPLPSTDRMPPGSRWAYSVPSHKLARQIIQKLPGRVLHRFSPVSHCKPDGTPTCPNHEAARALAAGGQSVVKEFCEGRRKDQCPEYRTCIARLGESGPPAASLIVGPHALAPEISDRAGKSGVLVIDEPGEPTFTVRVTLEDLTDAAKHLESFYSSYARAIAPALYAWTAWIREVGGLVSSPVKVRDAVLGGATYVPEDVTSNAGIDPETPLDKRAEAVLATALGAIPPDARPPSPPLRWSEVAFARKDPVRAAELGRASRVLDVLWHALAMDPPCTATLDERDGERAATVTGINAAFARAVNRDGPVVILDANADLHLAAIGKVTGFAPKLVEVHVADGAPIERAVLVCSRATRSRWMPRGVPVWREGITTALRAAVSWVKAHPEVKRVGLITWATIETALRLTLRPDDARAMEAWEAAGMTEGGARTARRVLGGILADLGGVEVLTGHYGGLEGLDDWAECDAIVTIGDPRPNVGEVIDRAQFLSLDGEARCDQLAQAELEQAHGRLRTIHRSRSGWQLHVGSLLPGGWAGREVSLLPMPVGRSRTPPTMTAEEFREVRKRLGLSERAMGRALRISQGAVQRYEQGKRLVPGECAVAARSLALSDSETY